MKLEYSYRIRLSKDGELPTHSKADGMGFKRTIK